MAENNLNVMDAEPRNGGLAGTGDNGGTENNRTVLFAVFTKRTLAVVGVGCLVIALALGAVAIWQRNILLSTSTRTAWCIVESLCISVFAYCMCPDGVVIPKYPFLDTTIKVSGPIAAFFVLLHLLGTQFPSDGRYFTFAFDDPELKLTVDNVTFTKGTDVRDYHLSAAPSQNASGAYDLDGIYVECVDGQTKCGGLISSSISALKEQKITLDMAKTEAIVKVAWKKGGKK